MQAAEKLLIRPAYKVKICGVYAFRHSSGMCYVGSSLDCEKRKRGHLTEILGRKRQHFHKEAAKMGIDNFAFEILEECGPDERFEKEAFHIKKENSVNNGFNKQKNPEVRWGHSWDEEMRLAQSKRAKEQHGTPEGRARASIKNKKFFEDNPKARDGAALHFANYFNKPGAREYWLLRHKEGRASPGFRAKASASGKKRFSTIESRRDMSNKKKAAFLKNPDMMESKRTVVDQMDLNGNLIENHKSLRHAALATGVSASSISQAIRKKGTAGGFRWMKPVAQPLAGSAGNAMTPAASAEVVKPKPRKAENNL